MSEFANEATNLRARCLERLEELTDQHKRVDFDPNADPPTLTIRDEGIKTHSVIGIRASEDNKFALETTTQDDYWRLGGPTSRHYLDDVEFEDVDLDELCKLVDHVEQVIHDNDKYLEGVARTVVAEVVNRLHDTGTTRRYVYPKPEDPTVQAVVTVLRREIRNLKTPERSQ